jgi:hypothetical protein
MTTFQRANSHYDDQHEAELVDAVMRAIFATSKVSDVDAVVLRTGEAANALVTALSTVLALSPGVMRSPTAIRVAAEQVRKRLMRRVAEAANSDEVRNFKRHCFGGEGEGNA